jgi:hypothetical protein
MFFINDAGDTGTWRLKGHVKDNLFWEWLSSWAIMMRKPSDIGFDDNGFILPPLEIHEHVIPFKGPKQTLFVEPAETLSERRHARIDCLDDRVKIASDLANQNGANWIAWCNLNVESESLSAALDNSIEVRGSDSPEYKENAVQWFCNEKCICKEPAFRAKLSTWKIKNNTSENTIKKTEPKNWSNQENGNSKIKREERNTCKNTSNQTGRNSEEPPINKNDITKSEKQNMLSMATCETRQGSMLKNGSPAIQKKGLHKGLSLMESHQSNIGLCLQDKKTDAQFADRQILETKEQIDFTSTIAIKQGLSEGSCAQTATWQSENSKTTQIQSKEPTCICGATSKKSKKVLISKPKMFGYGLNLQNCHNMAFVGLSDSYEQFYQAVRRCWRFGQTETVHAHIITGEREGNVVANIKRKEADMMGMFDGMVKHMNKLMTEEIMKFKKTKTDYQPKVEMTLPGWI